MFLFFRETLAIRLWCAGAAMAKIELGTGRAAAEEPQPRRHGNGGVQLGSAKGRRNGSKLNKQSRYIRKHLITILTIKHCNSRYDGGV